MTAKPKPKTVPSGGPIPDIASRAAMVDADMAAELASRLTAVAGELSEQGTEVVVTVQRVPVPGWRYLRPLVKVTCKPGKPV